ncbi:MAG: hypothetical protein EA001_12455 [Oscillatoriales cyanobacterium]|nr:MAG: hypothetical protein EA001_12455 [Oscillatoriales cyanobacterium]
MSDLIAPASAMTPTEVEALMAEAKAAIAEGQFDRVLELLDQVGDRLDAWRRVYWGQQLIDARAVEVATTLLRKITKQSPQAPESWAALGNCLSRQGDRAEAQNCFRQAHLLRGWLESRDHGYEFSQDWFSNQLPNWNRHIAPLKDQQDQHKGQPLQGLEIGSFEGMSACWLLDRVLTHPGSQLTCIDPSPQAAFRPNLAKTGRADSVQVLEALSWEALESLRSYTYDLAYIDGCHAPWVAFRDAVQTWPIVRTGGIVVIDDYRYQGHPDECPKPGVDLFMALFAGCFELLNNDYQLFLRKIRDWDGATAPLDRVLLLTDDPMLLDGLGWFLGTVGQLDLAQRVCERAIALYPTTAYAYMTLAQIWAQRGPLPETLPRRYSPLTCRLVRYFACVQPSEVAFTDQLDLEIIVAYLQAIDRQVYWHSPVKNLLGLLDYQIQRQELSGAITAWQNWADWAARGQWGQSLNLPTNARPYRRMAELAIARNYSSVVPLVEVIAAIAHGHPPND